jgi:hypothetical protein
MIDVRSWLALPALAVALALPARALADDAPSDAVYLADGRVLHGTVVDVIPNVALELQLANGDLAVVPREQVMRFEHTASPPKPRLEGPSRTVRSAGWVHIDAPTTTSLEWSNPHGREPGGWVTVCAGPCDRPLPTDGAYRISGEGLKTSDAFALGVDPGESETLHVHGASRAASKAGLLTLIVGPALAIATSFAIVMVGPVAKSEPLDDGGRTAIEVSLGAGLASALVGAGLLLANTTTSVSQDVVPLASGPTGSLPSHGAREAATAAAPRLIAGAPLFTLRF